MSTLVARAGDRMDILAARHEGELTTATLGAWLRANPDLPYALPAGTVVNVPPPEDLAFAYGSSYAPLDKSALPVTSAPADERVHTIYATEYILTSGQLSELHLSPVELVPETAPGESILPLAAILQLRGGSPGQAADYGDRENVILGWLDQYDSGGVTVAHRPQWGRTTLDALIRAGRDDADGPPFAVLVSHRFLWQPGVRPGKALSLWLSEALSPVPGDAGLAVTACYIVADY